MEFISNCFIGILIGAGAILPGISSGVLCVIFGIYEKLVNSILDFFQDIKGNLKFLFPIIVGIGIGIITFGNILRILFSTYPIQTHFAFMGLILGTIPALVKTANSKTGFRLHYVLYTITTFLMSVLLVYIEKININTNFIGNTSFLFLIISGFIMSVGVVVPGVSSSVLLMILSTYDIYLIGVSTMNFNILMPMGIGIVCGGLFFLKLTQYFIKNYFTQTYYIVIGFVLGSLLILYPGFEFNFTGLISITIFILCYLIGKTFEKGKTY